MEQWLACQVVGRRVHGLVLLWVLVVRNLPQPFLDVWTVMQHRTREPSSLASADLSRELSVQQAARLAWLLVLWLALVQGLVGLHLEEGSEVLVVVQPSLVQASYPVLASSLVVRQPWVVEQPLASISLWLLLHLKPP
jgi:hypothetical protein